MPDDSIVIVSARRTAIGAFQGKLAPLSAPELGAAAIKAVLADCGVSAADIGEVLMGCVLPAGIGQAPARQAALTAGLPQSVGATTVNKVCGSGMKTIMFGHDMIKAGSADIIVAGGMESMSNAPYLLPKARQGYRMGHQKALDHMLYDGLQNPGGGESMGHFGEQCAEKYDFSREAQDEFATESFQRAREANEGGAFEQEITPVTVKTRKHEETVGRDEEPFKVDLAKIPTLKPAFRRDGGTVTAASSSAISDGAAALVLMRASEAEKRDLQPLAKIIAHGGFAHAPEWFTTAPVYAVKKLQERLGWSPDNCDLYEINEAFAVVAMAAMQELGIRRDQLNINGGACALGHPIGCSGARIVVSLIQALRTRGLKRGIASLCLGGGEATAIAVETI
jgi:acetyl-CoA C-acetyltransferase